MFWPYFTWTKLSAMFYVMMLSVLVVIIRCRSHSWWSPNSIMLDEASHWTCLFPFFMFLLILLSLMYPTGKEVIMPTWLVSAVIASKNFPVRVQTFTSPGQPKTPQCPDPGNKCRFEIFHSVPSTPWLKGISNILVRRYLPFMHYLLQPLTVREPQSPEGKVEA